MSDITSKVDGDGNSHHQPASTTGHSQTTEEGREVNGDTGSSFNGSVSARTRGAGSRMAIAPPIANKRFAASIKEKGDQIIAANRRAYNAWDFGYTFWRFPELELLGKKERSLVMAYIEQERDIATRALRRPRDEV